LQRGGTCGLNKKKELPRRAGEKGVYGRRVKHL